MVLVIHVVVPRVGGGRHVGVVGVVLLLVFVGLLLVLQEVLTVLLIVVTYKETGRQVALTHRNWRI